MVTRDGMGKVLVVDNDEGVTHALSLRLQDAGYGCAVAHSGSQALSIFMRSPIDVIVTDLNMPCGGGAALIQSVRQVSDLPIIVLTGFSDQMSGPIKGKGVTVLRKPYEIQAVLDLIEFELIQRGRRAA